MYSHDPVEQQQHAKGLAVFAEQTRRHLAGELDEPEFRTLRLRHGLCIRRHGPMLRMALPYGLLSSRQLRALACVARRWDRGYVNFNARQQVEFHWLRLADAPAMLTELARVQLRAVRADGTSALKIHCAPLAGMAADELLDPLPWCELLHQWAQRQQDVGILTCGMTMAVSGGPEALSSIGTADIGLQAIRQDGQNVHLGFSLSLGSELVHGFVPAAELLGRLLALLRVYQQQAQREGACRRRLPMLMQQLGHKQLAIELQAQWQQLRSACLAPDERVSDALLARCAARFSRPRYASIASDAAELNARHASFEPRYARWLSKHVLVQRPAGYAAVLLPPSRSAAPGHFGADQMEVLAALAERYGLGQLRLARGFSLMLVDVRRSALYPLWCELDLLGLATLTPST